MAETAALTREKILEIAGAMPAAPRIFADLSRLLRDPNSPLERIAELIKRDAALTAHIIRVGNSAVYGGEQRTGAVEEAVSRIGYQEIFQLAGYVASAQLAERSLKFYGIESAQLRAHMVHTAFMCEQLALECKLDPRLAYTAGLVRPMGLFVCDRLAERWPAIEAFRPELDRDYLVWEGRIFGIGNDEVAALVLQEWRFPDEIIAAIRAHYRVEEADDPRKLACLLNLASGLVADEGHGLPGEAGHWGVTPQKLEILGVAAKKLKTLAAKANKLFAGFQQRMEGMADAAATVESDASVTAILPDSCDFPAPAGVLKENYEPTVHTRTAEADVTSAPTDFTTFMRNYQDMVYSTAVRLIGNETQAEDIAQETFIRAHQHFDNLSTSPTAGGWLKTVATNLSINHIQRYKKRWSFFSDLVRRDDEGSEQEVEFAAPDTFFSAVDSSERREWLERALEKLPEHQRVPLVLYHFEEMPYEEIARKTRVSLSKVKTDILRGREALAKILARSGSAHEKFNTRGTAMNPLTPEELEKFIHQNLRALPSRRAPRSLEARVLAALEQQALIPWYHRSWSYWPAAVRASFLIVALGVAAAVLAGFYLGYNGVDPSVVAAQAGQRLGLLAQIYHLAVWLADFGSQVVGTIPALWIYGAIAVVAGLYATFFGLGAAAYRTLYRQN